MTTLPVPGFLGWGEGTGDCKCHYDSPLILYFETRAREMLFECIGPYFQSHDMALAWVTCEIDDFWNSYLRNLPDNICF